MSGKAEEIKGRVKEAAGAMTDDDKLRREGKIDQATGKVKQAAEKVVDKAKEAAQRTNEKTKPWREVPICRIVATFFTFSSNHLACALQ